MTVQDHKFDSKGADVELFRDAVEKILNVRETRAVSTKGKKYLQVSDRVDVMRRVFGGRFGVETELVHYGEEVGSAIVVKATIYDLQQHMVIATGHAEELRSDNARSVNFTSAVENAETSAIGRALSALGLGGGEFASANELDGVERKTEVKAMKAKIEDDVDPLDEDDNPGDVKPEDPVEVGDDVDLRQPGDETTTSLNIRPINGNWAEVSQAQWETTSKVLVATIDKFATTLPKLKDTWTKNIGLLDAMEKHSPELFAKVKDHFTATKLKLKGE